MGAHEVIIPLQNGRHFSFVPVKPKGQRGLDLKHIAYMINYIAEHYDEPTPHFTNADVVRIVWRLLYKREPYRVEEKSRDSVQIFSRPPTLKQQLFVKYLFTPGCIGNRAKAARLAGYSPKRAKQTAYDLMHGRTY